VIRRAPLVYFLLALVWALVIAWQAVEHHWVVNSARAALINRSSDITTILGVVIRSQRRMGGAVFQSRLETALKDLVNSRELTSVALLNASGEVVASAGKPMDLAIQRLQQTGQRWGKNGGAVVQWGKNNVTIVNSVDLGAGISPEGEPEPTIVLPRRDSTNRVRGDDRFGRPPFPPPWATNQFPGTNFPPGDRFATNREAVAGGTNARPARPRSGRPFWMNETEYQSLLERRGLHGLIISMSTDAVALVSREDVWMRSIIGCFASISVLGLALAWRTVGKSSELQLRLLRASELNTHLKEMNLAAAGLAHETRNPLNIIRGLAQMISKQGEASNEVRRKSREIIDEADRVTAQLNEFINYSRPREIRRTPVALSSVLGEVVRALNYDLEEKSITLRNVAEPLTIEADEQLLRQALFNLLLNAIQAVDAKGEIEIRAGKRNGAGGFVEIADNGPGISPEHRAEVFKPYFTTNQKGTGLGLAVVQQIVLAHGWEIECLPNEPHGATFRLLHLSVLGKGR